MSMVQQPASGKLWRDLLRPHVEHKFEHIPSVKHNIDKKKLVHDDWPRSLSEYPIGHLPANPPGPCFAKCKCMEDWHLGKEFTEFLAEKLLEKNCFDRTVMAERKIEEFASCRAFVTRR